MNMKSGCYHHQIGMDYLWDAIFKMAAIEISRIIYFVTYNSVSKIDRDRIVVSYVYVDNTEKSLWLLVNSIFKMAAF